MSSIRETVRTTLDEEGFNSYLGHPAVDVAIVNLENREDTIIAKVREHRLLTGGEAEDLLVDVGLLERAPEPEPTPETEMTVEERLDHLVGVTTTLTDMITRLVNAATRNGITV